MDFDVDRMKAKIIEMWRQGRGDSLVKIVSLGQAPSPDRLVGYCTTLKFVVGRTPAQMESVLGFRAGTRLIDGADIYRVYPLPTASQFQFRGHTNTPEGISATDKAAHADFPPGLGAPQWELVGLQQSALRKLASVPAGEIFTFPVNTLLPSL